MDTSKIDNLLSQLRSASDLAAGRKAESQAATGDAGFGAVLKASLDQVNRVQEAAAGMAKEFELGSPNANLHDVMISLQKANISFQAAVQVRNKLVSAYHDIMNMQV